MEESVARDRSGETCTDCRRWECTAAVPRALPSREPRTSFNRGG